MIPTQDAQTLPNNTRLAQGANGKDESAAIALHNSARRYAGLTPWPPGQSGNVKGRPSAGAAVMEWTNQMQSWSEVQLRDVANDKAAPSNKVSAARWWLDVRCQDRTKGGMPVASTELQHLLDRTLGKPVQQTVSTSTSVEFSFDLGGLAQDGAGEASEGQASSVDGVDQDQQVSTVNMPRIVGTGDSLEADPTRPTSSLDDK